MTLDHLNDSFLKTNPLPATPFGTALVKSIRESILLHRPEPLYAGKEVFDWLLEMTESNPTATNLGKRFIRVQSGESFVDVIEIEN